jgi:hypothetical protein
VTALWQFYLVWAWLGLMMAATLYDAAFSIVTRARGARARAAITAITLAAGFASTLAYPLTAAVTASGGWRAAIWVLAALVRSSSCRSTARRARLEAEAQARDPASGAAASHGRDGATGFWPLGLGFALTALGAAILLTNLLPLMEALGVPGTSPSSPLRSSGPRRSAGRIVLTLAGARAAARGDAGCVPLHLGRGAGHRCGDRPPRPVLVFAVGLGVGNGVISILRPVVIREVMGDGGYGESAGAVARLSLFAFASAPGLGAVLADAAGYGAVLALCACPRLAGAALSGVCRPERKGAAPQGRPGHGVEEVPRSGGFGLDGLRAAVARSRSGGASAPRALRARGRYAACRSRGQRPSRGHGRPAGSAFRRRGWRCRDAGRCEASSSFSLRAATTSSASRCSTDSSASVKPATAIEMR